MKCISQLTDIEWKYLALGRERFLREMSLVMIVRYHLTIII